MQRGHLAEAAAEVEKGLSLMNNAPPMAYATLAEIYDLQADNAHREEVLKKIESMTGGDQVAGMARASALIRHGDVAGAERVLRAAIERHPTIPGLRAMLGQIQAQANQNQEALLSFRHLLGDSLYAAVSVKTGVYVHIAQVLHTMGRDREAFDQCRLALALDPGNPAAQSLKAELQSNLAARSPQP